MGFLNKLFGPGANRRNAKKKDLDDLRTETDTVKADLINLHRKIERDNSASVERMETCFTLMTRIVEDNEDLKKETKAEREEQARQREEDREEARLHREQMAKIMTKLEKNATHDRQVLDQMKKGNAALVQYQKKIQTVLEKVLPSENIDANRANDYYSMNLMMRNNWNNSDSISFTHEY